MLYTVTAVATVTLGNSSKSMQIPTFLLDSGIQGIVSAQHAEKIARDILDPSQIYDELHMNIQPR